MNPSIERTDERTAMIGPAMPSASGLAKQLGIALAGAAVILAIFILPAEYGIDPTGLGGKMGLLALSAPAPQVADIPMAPPEAARFYTAPVKSNVIEIRLEGDGEVEYKVRMKQGETMVYSWSVDNGSAYYDFHAEGEPGGEDIRYKEEQDGAPAGHGSLVAPMNGIHGWYWLNLQEHPIVITLRVSGFYELRSREEQDVGTVKE
jgi:hypothetical protein